MRTTLKILGGTGKWKREGEQGGGTGWRKQAGHNSIKNSNFQIIKKMQITVINLYSKTLSKNRLIYELKIRLINSMDEQYTFCTHLSTLNIHYNVTSRVINAVVPF